MAREISEGRKVFEQNLQILKENLTWLGETSPEEVIEKHSQTFRLATKMFPEETREKVRIVYAFVRVADDLIDLPAEEQLTSLPVYNAYKEVFQYALQNNQETGIPVIDAFIDVSTEYDFPLEWADSFFNSMEMDIAPGPEITTLDDLLEYDYGSASVIGLMCAKIFGIEDDTTLGYADWLGKAFQHINFARDAHADVVELDRNYFPQNDYIAVGVPVEQVSGINISDLNNDQLEIFMEIQLKRFEEWLNIGAQGFPELIRTSPGIGTAVMTASILYEKAANRIRSNPGLIMEGKVSPTKLEKLTSLIQSIYFVIVFLLSSNGLEFYFEDGIMKVRRVEES